MPHRATLQGLALSAKAGEARRTSLTHHPPRRTGRALKYLSRDPGPPKEGFQRDSSELTHSHQSAHRAKEAIEAAGQAMHGIARLLQKSRHRIWRAQRRCHVHRPAAIMNKSSYFKAILLYTLKLTSVRTTAPKRSERGARRPLSDSPPTRNDSRGRRTS